MSLNAPINQSSLEFDRKFDVRSSPSLRGLQYFRGPSSRRRHPVRRPQLKNGSLRSNQRRNPPTSVNEVPTNSPSLASDLLLSSPYQPPVRQGKGRRTDQLRAGNKYSDVIDTVTRVPPVYSSGYIRLLISSACSERKREATVVDQPCQKEGSE